MTQEGTMENMTLNDVMIEMQVSKRTMLRWLKAGQFPNAFKIGDGKTSHWRIPRSDVEDFKTRHKIDLGKENIIE
jgi:excisionase family DNA binding protein